MSKRPLLWHSNAGWSTTGYGAQTALFTSHLKKRYKMGISAFYGLEGAPLEHNGIPTFPGMAGTYGNETISLHSKAHFGESDKGLIVTLMDVWVLDSPVWKELKVVAWVPVDHEPVPPLVQKFFLETDAVPMAMSHFGQEQLADYDPLYCPHAVDTKVYAPKPQEESRKAVNLPQDRFIVGMVAANKGQPSRKAFPQAMQAFKAFSDRHPDALLYLHTEMLGKFEGVNMPALINNLGLADKVALTDQYRYLFSPVQASSMASIYSAMDVLLNPSTGEGFGLPILEAQSCGVPAIVTDFSAMKEVCGAGWKVDYRPIWTPQMSWMADPVIEDIVESLESAYQQSAAGKQLLSTQARTHAESYDIEVVMREHMFPALEEAEQRLGLAKAPKKVAVL